MNVYAYNPKAESKHACIIDAAIAYDEPETGQVVVFLIQQVIEMKSLNHYSFSTCNAVQIVF